MSTATATETEETTALRTELKEAKDRIIGLEADVEQLQMESTLHECFVDGDIVEKLQQFADPANWVQRLSDDKYVWSPYMAVTEQDPVTLANQILDLLKD